MTRKRSRNNPWKPNSSRQLEAGLEVVRQEVETACRFFFTEVAVHDLARQHAGVARAIRSHSAFWRAVADGMHNGALLALGRILDHEQDAITMGRLLKAAADHPGFFTRRSLRARLDRQRLQSRPIIDDIVSRSELIDRASIRPPYDRFLKLQQQWDKHYRPIRHQVLAHTVMRRRKNQVQRAYAKTNVRWLAATLLELDDMALCMQDLLYHGAKPILGRRPATRFQSESNDAARRALARFSGVRIPEPEPEWE